MDVEIVSKTELARRTREVIDRVRHGGRHVVVENYGSPEVAIIDIEEYRHLVALQQRETEAELRRQEESLIDRLTATRRLTRQEAAEIIAHARDEVQRLLSTEPVEVGNGQRMREREREMAGTPSTGQ
ncbi:MAG: type II toxin-antitoxin system prevent-host-death family antitoxin [Anaerolineae bacterium]